jgi:multiple sugar transport system substrate-binding protein
MSSKLKKRLLTRREALKIFGASAVGGMLAACGPTPTPEVVEKVVKETVEVPVKETIVVTPTPVPEVAKPLAGKTARVMMVGNPMMEMVKEMAPAYEEEAGLRVIMETYGFDVLQQRLDLELSTGSGAYDVVQMVMIFIGRVIEAGWATDLMPFIEAEDYDLADFVPGTINMFKRGDGLYALPWVPDSMGTIYRKDLFDAAGVSAFPETFEELLEVAPKIHSSEVVFTTAENNWHWIWPLYLQSYGGNFFVDPPDDLTPTFNTPEAIESAKVMVELFSKYSFPDAVSVGIPEAGTALAQGTAACGMSGLGVLMQALNPEVSTVLDKVAFAPVPKGPAGWFPQLAMHGYMIPAGCQQPEIAWEAIKWLVSPEVSRRFALELNFFARNRYSILNDPEVKEKFVLSGTDPLQVLADSMAQAGAGYMVYRTVPPFRAVGAEVIRAFGEMITGQKSAEDALDDLQKNATEVLIEAGYL